VIAGRLSPGAITERSWSSRTLPPHARGRGIASERPKLEQAFIASVIAEGITPPTKRPYKNARHVEFETPASKEGLGTSTRLRKESIPIQGMAKFKEWFRPAAPVFIC
jgi:hypothetical protein